jgi:hypothetical protein
MLKFDSDWLIAYVVIAWYVRAQRKGETQY